MYNLVPSTVVLSVILSVAKRTWESTPPPPASWIAANAFLIVSVTERETWRPRPPPVLEMPKCANEGIKSR